MTTPNPSEKVSEGGVATGALAVEAGEDKYVAAGTESQGRGFFVVRPDGSAVCWVQHVEDARLFAAAHDLAEALIELDRELLFDKPVSGTAAKAFAKARAAISKARGA